VGARAALAGGGSDGPPPDPRLDRAALTRLGTGLRTMYEADLGREPIPDNLLALLERASKPNT